MRFLKDIEVGETVKLGSHTFNEEEIVRFGTKFDRQDYHMDAERAKKSVFGGLIASGWHTSAIYMKLLVAYIAAEQESHKAAGKPAAEFSASPGLDEVKWPRPVHAGDTITYNLKVTDKRPLKSRPGWGLMQQLTEAFNQNGDLVLTMSGYSILQWDENSIGE